MITKVQTLNLIVKLCVLLKCSVLLQELRPTVTLPQGIVVGVKVYLPRVTVNAFLGIPYAEPPIGALRFAVPERNKGWSGPRFASNYGNLCPYYTSNSDMNDQEDCLYLNVWTTSVRLKLTKFQTLFTNKGKIYPVLNHLVRSGSVCSTVV